MSRKITDLHPQVQRLAIELIAEAAKAGIPLIITQTLRTSAEQQALYDKGRTTQGEPCRCVPSSRAKSGHAKCPKHPLGLTVTNAKAGESYHNYGLAFDVAFVSGKRIIWGNEDLNTNRINDWEEIGKLGEQLGLEWGGRWRFKDLPHFQYTFGLTINQLKKGQRP